MHTIDQARQIKLCQILVEIVSETNGISLVDTIDLAINSSAAEADSDLRNTLIEFRRLLFRYKQRRLTMSELLRHPMAKALYSYFIHFPLRFHEDHIHLTGSLHANFLFPRIKQLLEGPNAKAYEQKIKSVYGVGYKLVVSS